MTSVSTRRTWRIICAFATGLCALVGAGGASVQAAPSPLDDRTVSLDEIGDPDGRATSVLAEVFGARFAGTWVDHDADRRQVALVDPVPTDGEQARSALSGEDAGLVGNGIDVVAVDRSLSDLEALRDAAVQLLRQSGVVGYAVGVHLTENIVDGVIQAHSWDDERLGPLRDLVAGSDGALVLHLGTVQPLGPGPEGDGQEQPANWSGICFVRLSYEVFLERAPSEADEQGWVALLEDRLSDQAGPASVGVFFEFLVASDEWLGGTVAGLYQQALDRAPEPAGQAYWTGQLRRGVRVHKVASSVFGSAELYSGAGGTDEAFVTSLYERILHRSPDQAGLAYWVEQVRAAGTDSVAARLFESYESRSARVTALYQQVLGRDPDPGGKAYWSERMLRLDDVRVAAALATSIEFIHRSWRICDPPVEGVIY